jgi:hypothetical protein
MTFTVRHVVSVLQYARNGRYCDGLLWRAKSMPPTFNRFYDFFIGCHMGHCIEFTEAVIYFLYLWPWVAASFASGSATEIVTAAAATFAYNLAWGVTTYQTWHVLLFSNFSALYVGAPALPHR